MKILFVSFQNPEKDLNGVACHIRDLQKALTKIKIETNIISPYIKNDSLIDLSITKLKNLSNRLYKRFNSEYLFYLNLYLTQIQLKNRLRNIDSDFSIINVQDIISLLAVTNLRIKIPIVFTCHFLTEPWIEFSNAGYFKPNSFIFKRFKNKCRKSLLYPNLKFISVSQRNKNLLLNVIPELNSESIFIGHLGLDLQFSENKVEIQIPKQNYILNVGKLDKIKNQRLFLELAENLKRIQKKILFVIAGPVDLIEKEFMLNEINKKGLESFFLFTGPLNRDSIYFLMKNATLYIHTAKMESFGMAIVEAMGSNTCVLVRENDAILEITEGEKEGIFSSSMKGEELMKYVIQYLDDKNKRDQLKEKQMQIFKKNYTLDKMRDNFLKYYRIVEEKVNG